MKANRINLSTFGMFTAIHLVVLIVYTKFEDFEKIIGKKENGQKKEKDKPYVAVSFLHIRTCHYRGFYQLQSPMSSSC